MVTKQRRIHKQPVPPPDEIIDLIQRSNGQVELLMTLQEVCFALRMSEPLVLEALDTEQLVGRRFGKNKLFFLASDVNDFMKSRPSWISTKATRQQSSDVTLS